MAKIGSNHLKFSKTLRISMLFTYFQPFSAGSTGSTGSMNYAPGGGFKPVFSKTGFFEGFWTLEKTKKMAKNVLNFGAIGANKG